ncbi:MAG: PqqD family peptide modification chaperone, partial [Thiotrichaceae bacterium]|nr:PqqD family peptide modification chaperone [Thiotrichaceae bacterium]
MTTHIPIIRADLSFSRQETDEGSFFIVKDQESGRFYRFGEIEYYIIKHLDGKNPLATICTWVAEKYGTTLDEDTLEGFISSLKQRGLLENSASSTDKKTQQRRIKGTLLYLRFSAFDPDQLLNYLVVKLRFIFTPYFIFFSAALVLLSWLVLLTHADEIQRDIASHLSLGSLFTLWLVILITVTAHEFAHGLTCKYFGGEVHEIGFLLLFFMP